MPFVEPVDNGDRADQFEQLECVARSWFGAATDMWHILRAARRSGQAGRPARRSPRRAERHRDAFLLHMRAGPAGIAAWPKAMYANPSSARPSRGRGRPTDICTSSLHRAI